MACKSFIAGVTGLGKSQWNYRQGIPRYVRELKQSVGPETRVELYAWDEFEQIIRDLKKWKYQHVYGFGHSYGASTLNFVFDALRDFPQIQVKHAVYCDPVWRSEIHKIDKDSLDANHQLVIPGNVEKLSTIEQDRTFITGHDCITGPRTEHVRREVVEGKWWNLINRHGFLDRHPLFREMVFESVLGS